MPIQWHPILVRLLRMEMGDVIEITEELPLGESPVRVDMAMQRKGSVWQLPSPYCYLGEHTLTQFKGPQDVARAEDLAKLEGYGIAYQLQGEIRQRERVALWLAASRFSEGYLQAYGARIEGLEEIESGIFVGTMDGFPLCILNLQEMEVSRERLPWLMVSSGRKEREVIEYVVEHHEELRIYVEYAAKLHWEVLKEVLAMKGMDLEAIGFDLRQFAEDVGIDKLVQAIGIERVISVLGIERVINTLGIERVVEEVPVEELIQALARRYGKERLHQILDGKIEGDGGEGKQ